MFYFQGGVIHKERKLQTQFSESKLCHIHLSTFLLWQTEVLPDYDHLTAHIAPAALLSWRLREGWDWKFQSSNQTIDCTGNQLPFLGAFQDSAH